MKPSRQDEELTHKLKEGGKFLDVKILDHLIISLVGNTTSLSQTRGCCELSADHLKADYAMTRRWGADFSFATGWLLHR